MIRPVSTYRNIGRYRQIANVLARQGFGFVLDQTGLSNLVSLPLRLFRPSQDGVSRLTIPERVRIALEQLGPTAIKMGQVLSTRPDLLPPDWIAELERLQDTVPPFGFEDARRVVERELGRPLEEAFASFAPEPIAAASLAQVHEAQLPSGQPVAVKVQRPRIAVRIEQDIAILRDLAGLLERRTELGQIYQLSDIVDEFATIIREELDFVLEGRNAEQFRRNSRDNPDVFIPRVFWTHTARRALTLERVSGIKINDIQALRAAGFRLPSVAEAYAHTILDQILIHGFFHGDPHPGNVLVSRNRQIVFLDFGMVGHLDPVLKRQLVDLVIAVVRWDIDRVTRSLLDIGVVRGKVDLKGLQRDIGRLVRRYYNVPIRQIPVHEVIQESLRLAFKYQVIMPTNLTLLARAMSTTNGVATTLDPKLSVVDIAEPLARRLLAERTSPQALVRTAVDTATNVGTAFYDIPLRLSRLLQQAERGELIVQTTNVRPGVTGPDWNGIVNRAALALVVAAGSIGSALLMLAGRGPAIEGLPVVGLAGLAVSILLGLLLLFSLLRSS